MNTIISSRIEIASRPGIRNRRFASCHVFNRDLENAAFTHMQECYTKVKQYKSSMEDKRIKSLMRIHDSMRSVIKDEVEYVGFIFSAKKANPEGSEARPEGSEPQQPAAVEADAVFVENL